MQVSAMMNSYIKHEHGITGIRINVVKFRGEEQQLCVIPHVFTQHSIFGLDKTVKLYRPSGSPSPDFLHILKTRVS